MASPFEQARETRRLAAALDGFARLPLLRAGLRLGLFDALREPRSAAELADRLALAPDLVEAWARVLHADGLLRERDGRYGLGPASAWMLHPSRAAALRDLIEHLAEHAAFRMLELPELMKGAERPAEDAREALRREGAIARLVGDRALRALLRIPAARHARRILGIAGGRSDVVAGLLGRRRDATATALELDAAGAEDLGRRLAGAGVARRAEVHAMDPARLEPPGAGFDLALVGPGLHRVAPDRRAALIRAAADRLAPGGALAVELWVPAHGRLAELLGLRTLVLLLDLLLRTHRDAHGLPDPGAVRAALGAAGLEPVHESAILPGGVARYVWAARSGGPSR